MEIHAMAYFVLRHSVVHENSNCSSKAVRESFMIYQNPWICKLFMIAATGALNQAPCLYMETYGYRNIDFEETDNQTNFLLVAQSVAEE